MKREEVIADASKMYKGVFVKAFAGEASPREAIKAMCLHCIGYERAEITNCTNQGCPLWEYRPYRPKSAPSGA